MERRTTTKENWRLVAKYLVENHLPDDSQSMDRAYDKLKAAGKLEPEPGEGALVSA
jgi:hypothetical protein